MELQTLNAKPHSCSRLREPSAGTLEDFGLYCTGEVKIIQNELHIEDQNNPEDGMETEIFLDLGYL